MRKRSKKNIDPETKGIDLGTKGRKCKVTLTHKLVKPIPVFKPMLNVDIKEIDDE